MYRLSLFAPVTDMAQAREEILLELSRSEKDTRVVVEDLMGLFNALGIRTNDGYRYLDRTGFLNMVYSVLFEIGDQEKASKIASVLVNEDGTPAIDPIIHP